jgi:hypothetical protein
VIIMQRKRHVKITIDIPNEVGFDWDAAISMWRSNFPTPDISLNAATESGAIIHTWRKEYIKVGEKEYIKV